MASLITSGNKMAKDIQSLMRKYEYTLEQAQKCYWQTFERDIKYGLLQANMYAKIKREMMEAGELPHLCDPNKLVRTYNITVRPNEKKITFKDFYVDVMKFVGRACFEDYKLSFEQKGTCNNTLGQGFHVHILAKMRQRSKGEVLRDTISTFTKYTADNCIEVKNVPTEDDYTKALRYITHYESKDGHKAVTQEWDILWREKNGLQQIYASDGTPQEAILPPIKSVRGQDSMGNPFVVELA